MTNAQTNYDTFKTNRLKDFIREAIVDLHASTEVLAAAFAVDLARAHQARLEALLGAPLPVSLVEGRGEER